MDDALTAWLDATGPWAAEFWERSVSETVRESPDTVVALGDSDRKLAKGEVARLIANARAHIRRRLVDDRTEDWPHLKPQTDPGDPAFRRHGTIGPFDARRSRGTAGHSSVPEAVAGRLDGVLGDVASVSAHHGFALTGFQRGDPYGHKGQWHPDRERKPEWSEEMVETMSAYGALHARYVSALIEGQRVSGEKKRSEATDLWDEA